VAEAQSISSPAPRLGLSESVVCERLAELERVLGTRLLQRTIRKVLMTADGVAFLARARRIVRERPRASGAPTAA
jgi:DNA-binding transcriptional LysR family regulator